MRSPLLTIAREWLRIGCIGFGGPPAHIALLRKLCVERRGWLSADEFEDGVATTGLLPGPASTQLAIYCAWRLAGPAGAVVGGICFIVPGLIVILALSALFLAAHPPLWVAGAAAGAGAAVPAVAAQAALSLAPASWRRARGDSAARTANAPATDRTPDTNGPTSSAPVTGSRSESRGDVGALGASGRSESIRRPGWRIAIGWPNRRWLAYLVIGAVLAALAGPFLVIALVGCGVAELVLRTGLPAARRGGADPTGAARSDGAARPEGTGGAGGSEPDSGSGLGRLGGVLPMALAAPVMAGGLLAVAWVAFKVGALSYGGGFVIIPLMQHDAVHTYHWMTGAQFLSAVALGQVTPGPVVQTVAVVGYAAAGVGGGLLASCVAFTPSFAFVLAGAPRFAALRRNARVQAFLTGAGPAAIGAIAGSTIPLGFDLAHLWQAAVLGLAAVWLLAVRKNVVAAIVGAAALGVIAALAGAPVG